MSDIPALERAYEHARSFLNELGERRVAVDTTLAELRSALGKPLQDEGLPPELVIDELARDAGAGLLGSAGGRFFGWVIGGGLPAAVAADWLASVWDQNAALYACSPAASVVEEIAGEWLKELLGLPAGASFGFVTGCQMAHVTALSAARQKLLSDRGWDVGAKGLAGAPQIRVLTSPHRHESLTRAVSLLGIGSNAVEYVPCDERHRISLPDLKEMLAQQPDSPAVVCLQAGDLNTGVFDPFEEACAAAEAHGAWVHVDGAFGLWAAASDEYRRLLRGVEKADSWATDGHKWLNVPFDSGLVFVAHPQNHRAALSTTASYFLPAPESARDEMDWNPEWSRRARGFTVYAALRSLGRKGLAELVERCCRHARRLVDGIGAMNDVEVLAEPVINQGLVRFLGPGGDHDRCTDEVIDAVRAEGVAWFGGTTWNGMRAMRISVCNWRTTDEDVERTVESVRGVLAR